MLNVCYLQCNQTESSEQILDENTNNSNVIKESKKITIPDIYEVVQHVRIQSKFEFYMLLLHLI